MDDGINLRVAGDGGVLAVEIVVVVVDGWLSWLRGRLVGFVGIVGLGPIVGLGGMPAK